MENVCMQCYKQCLSFCSIPFMLVWILFVIITTKSQMKFIRFPSTEILQKRRIVYNIHCKWNLSYCQCQERTHEDVVNFLLPKLTFTNLYNLFDEDGIFPLSLKTNYLGSDVLLAFHASISQYVSKPKGTMLSVVNCLKTMSLTLIHQMSWRSWTMTPSTYKMFLTF